MALDFTLLTEEQIWGGNALDVLKEGKYGVKTSATDLAILLGAFVAREESRTSENDFACLSWTRSSPVLSGGVLCVSSDPFRETAEGYTLDRDIAVRPVLLATESAKITPAVVKEGVNGVEIVEYGEYPQTIADERTSAELQKLFEAQELQKTGKEYTFDTAEYYDRRRPFSSQKCAEYEYEGKKYICVMGNPRDHDSNRLSTGGCAEYDKSYWVQVEPIEWLRDPSGIWVSKRCLFAGIQFDREEQYNGNFEQTKMKQYLDTYFAKEIEPSEFLKDKERRISLEGLRARLAEAGDLDRARADTKPANTPERTEIAARMKRVRRERDVIRAAAAKAREKGDEKLLEQIAEIAKPSMARAEVVMDKFYARREARRAARAKKARD